MHEMVIIPARYGSERFPGKPLAKIRGHAMIERVWAIAAAAAGRERVYVATDHQGIAEAVRGFGGQALITSAGCRNGTERVWEAARQAAAEPQVVVNFQGDAVLTPPAVIRSLLEAIRGRPEIGMATAAVRLSYSEYQEHRARKAQGDATGTFVVFDTGGRALYFSKAAIPFVRRPVDPLPAYRHIGIYGYRLDVLRRYLTFAPGPLEQAEGLEQLRALEHGQPVQVITVDYGGRTHCAIDKPEDVRTAEEIIAREGELVEF